MISVMTCENQLTSQLVVQHVVIQTKHETRTQTDQVEVNKKAYSLLVLEVIWNANFAIQVKYEGSLLKSR